MLNYLVVIRYGLFRLIEAELDELCDSCDYTISPVEIVVRIPRDVHGAAFERFVYRPMLDEGNIDLLPQSIPIDCFSQAVSEGAMVLLGTHQNTGPQQIIFYSRA